jgi:hypothetical protein
MDFDEFVNNLLRLIGVVLEFGCLVALVLGALHFLKWLAS